MEGEEYLDKEYVFSKICANSTDGNCLGNEKLKELKSKSELAGNKELLSAINAAISDPTNSELQRQIMYHKGITDILADEEFVDTLIKGFKVPAPQGNKLFSNFNIDLILGQLHEMVPTFKNYNCVLMDFHTNNSEPLTQASMPNSQLIAGIKSGEIATFGTIPNTLVSTGDTSKVGHWVALFGDFRDDANSHLDSNGIWSVEYYNSTGNNAPAGMYKWMQQLAETIQSECNHKCVALNVSNVSSQQGPSECGIYSLHYIICRLMGIPYKHFREDKIPDKSIEKIRKIFVDGNKIPDHMRKKLRGCNYY